MRPTTTWNPAFYNQKHAFIYQYGESLVDILSPQPGERILDVGCGTGQLTNLISQKGALVVGIDSSQEMIAQAQASYPGIEFQVMDALKLPFKENFDAIFSNAVLHWIQPPKKVAQKLFQSLKPGGRMVVELGGKGNIQRIMQALKTQFLLRAYELNASINIWYFPSLGEYTTLLEKVGFVVQWAHYFDRDTELDDAANGIQDWIKMFGGAFFTGIPANEQEDIIQAAQETLRETNYHHDKWFADYKRLRIVATKISS